MIYDPSSINYEFYIESIYSKLFLIEKSVNNCLTQSEAFLKTYPIYALNFYIPSYLINLFKSFIPNLFDATWARRSEILSFILRDCLKSSLTSGYLKLSFSSVKWNFSTAIPYSYRYLLKGGILPGMIPPISAWCPREAKNIFIFYEI